MNNNELDNLAFMIAQYDDGSEKIIMVTPPGSKTPNCLFICNDNEVNDMLLHYAKIELIDKKASSIRFVKINIGHDIFKITKDKIDEYHKELKQVADMVIKEMAQEGDNTCFN